MPKCPNCGLETMRTEDWACRWCGYPLPQGPFRKIDKTYRQLREEKLYGTEETQQFEHETEPEAEPKTEPVIEQKQDLEAIKAINLEMEQEEKEQEEEQQGQGAGMVERFEEIEAGAELKEEKETETGEEIKPEAEEEVGLEPEEKQPLVEESTSGEDEQVSEAAKEDEAEGCEETAEQPEEMEEQQAVELKEEETEMSLEPEPEPEPEEPDIKLDIKELIEAYDEDDVAADERFFGKILRVTGVVSMIDIKERLDTHYIRITDGSRNCLQSLQCIFDKKHANRLRELEKGQKVTVQGRYNGSVIAIRIVECVLIK